MLGTQLNDYFSYFDMVYFINMPNRKDKYNNVMQMFSKLNITNYKHIVPISLDKCNRNVRLGLTAQSCMLAHKECYQNAIDNKYEKICIFEDDFCFNEDDETILENIDNHLSIIFHFLEKFDWNLFYFDNIISVTRKNNVMLQMNRYTNDNLFIRKINGKRFTHSYAISLNGCKSMINSINDCQFNIDDHVDKLLEELKINNKYLYTKGLFDQITNLTCDNKW